MKYDVNNGINWFTNCIIILIVDIIINNIKSKPNHCREDKEVGVWVGFKNQSPNAIGIQS